MGRLTEQDEQGNWCVKGLPWKDTYVGRIITENTNQKIYGALCKLKDYENSGLDPEEACRLKERDMANAIKDVICANMGDGKDTNVHGNDDYVMFTINDDGIAEAYDDTYDVTIHCESESERKRVIGMLERYQGWIPVEERLPEDERMVLVTCQTKKRN